MARAPARAAALAAIDCTLCCGTVAAASSSGRDHADRIDRAAGVAVLLSARHGKNPRRKKKGWTGWEKEQTQRWGAQVRAGGNDLGPLGDGRDTSSGPKSKRVPQQRSVLKLARSDSSFDVVVGAQSQSQPLDVTVRIVYSMAMYAGLILVGKLICDASGVDFWAGLRLDVEDFYCALLCALVPIFTSLVIHQDIVVDSWVPARAIRDAEDEELRSFYFGMARWQYTLLGGIAALAEEFFFRSAVQGGLAHALQVSSRESYGSEKGIAALTGIIPSFAPCAHAMAAVLTAAITGSMFYIISSPKDPKVVIARGNPGEVRKSLQAWNERQQQRKIYSPLLESLLSLYLGFEWIFTGNLLAPILTHALYYVSNVTLGVQRIEQQQKTEADKLRTMHSGTANEESRGR